MKNVRMEGIYTRMYSRMCLTTKGDRRPWVNVPIAKRRSNVDSFPLSYSWMKGLVVFKKKNFQYLISFKYENDTRFNRTQRFHEEVIQNEQFIPDILL
jgi:hypothetical protein